MHSKVLVPSENKQIHLLIEGVALDRKRQVMELQAGNLPERFASFLILLQLPSKMLPGYLHYLTQLNHNVPAASCTRERRLFVAVSVAVDEAGKGIFNHFQSRPGITST